MNQTAPIYIGLWREGRVRVYATDTRSIVQTITNHHHTTALASAALGRTVTVGAMMGAMLKEGSKLTIKIDGNGPLGLMIVDATSEGGVRGFITYPDVNLPLKSNGKLDVGRGVGRGTLSVTKSLSLKQNYATQVQLQSGEIGDDFSFFFLKSEQTPSVVAVGVLVGVDHSIAQSGGWIIQLMPDATEEDFQMVENSVKTMPQPTTLLEHMSIKEGLNSLLDGIQWIDQKVAYEYCTCSTERFINGIATLNNDEIEEMIREGGCDIHCEFCGKKYHLTEDHLKQSLAIKSENN